jgi:zinc transport system substrate-binding protein
MPTSSVCAARFRWCIAFTLASAHFACTPQRQPDGKPIIAVSVLPQAYVVEQLAGPWVDIQVMIPPGANPHTYEPHMGQMRQLAQAQLYVKIGQPQFALETAWLSRTLASAPQIRIIDSSASLPPSLGGSEDPHIWASPQLVRAFVPHLADALASLLPAHREDIARAAAAFVQEIDHLDAEIRTTLAGCAARRFLVFHPAWGHFAAGYGFEQVAIEHGAKEPTPGELARIVAAERAAGTRVLFVQPQFSKTTANVVAEEVGAKLVVIDPLAKDWPGTLRQAARALAEACQR